jgi:tRNA A37 threonylcarbamoyladenosine dehydratase
VRTNRNRNIINEREQKKLAAATIGILGLSIGNGMAVSLAYNGIGGQMKIADFDKLSVSNLNRVRAGLGEIGNHKVDITTQQIYEVNPHAKLTSFSKGVKKQDLDSFLTKTPQVNIVLEAIDDFEMKIRVRLAAKKAKIPVVMLTNLGDSLLIDVERYDTEQNTKLFNGLIGQTAEEILSKPVTEEDKKKYALAIVGKENVPPRVLESVMKINKTLVGRPQVMSTVTIGSGVAAYVVRKILLGDKVVSGRRRIVFDDFLMK